jgi:hypothetical protein
MKKALFFVAALVVCGLVAACGEKEVERKESVDVKETTAVESVPGEEIKEVLVDAQGEPVEDNTKIFINSEFMMKALEDSMQLDSKDFDFYQVSSFSNLDKNKFKYYIVSNVQIFDDISSLLILAASEHENVCWLVNYDKNNRHIAALTIGYDEWSENANAIDSVINTKGAPYYIEIANRSLDLKEIIKMEVLASGKFNEISRTNAGTGI